MSRVIKFRSWDLQTKSYQSFSESNVNLYVEGYLNEELADNSRFIYEQFTGCHDLERTEIYENDILVVREFDGWKDDIGYFDTKIVKWSNVEPRWGLYPLHSMDNEKFAGSFLSDGMGGYKVMFVVSNIHDELSPQEMVEVIDKLETKNPLTWTTIDGTLECMKLWMKIDEEVSSVEEYKQSLRDCKE